MFSKNSFPKVAGLFLLFVLMAASSQAHDVVGELENMSGKDTAILYLLLGFKHILPLGVDHIVFVLSLYLLSPKLKPVLTQATAFTIAHSVTLGLAMYGVITPSPSIVEPIIAISIVYVALENIFSPRLKKSRVLVVFLFGLIHGLGFANVLGKLGLPKESYLSSLILFNVGVEVGQVTVILSAFAIFGYWFGDKPYYRKYIAIPISALIAILGIYWTIQRIFFT